MKIFSTVSACITLIAAWGSNAYGVESQLVISPTPAPAISPTQITPQNTASTATTPEKKGFAQETILTPFLGENATYSGAGGVLSRYSQINGKNGWMTGGRGTLIINHTFEFGGGGMGLSNRINLEDKNNVSRELTFGYGGVYFGYTKDSSALMHPHFGILLGGGGANTKESSEESDKYVTDRMHKSGTTYFVAEPEASIEFNLVSFARISLTGSYRLVVGTGKIDDYGAKEFSSLAIGLYARFGAF